MDASADGGASWVRSLDLGGAPCASTDTAVLGLAVAPGSRGTIYAGTAIGPYVSSDHGAHWHRLDSTTPITPLAYEPRTPQILYGTFGGNLFRSTDGGLNWADQLSAAGEFGQGPIGISGSGSSLALLAASGLFGSSDEGAHWTYLGFKGSSVLELVFDPTGSTLDVVVAG